AINCIFVFTKSEQSVFPKRVILKAFLKMEGFLFNDELAITNYECKRRLPRKNNRRFQRDEGDCTDYFAGAKQKCSL
ncbi:hypothetical protein, partial [Ferruginibacter sp. HRS2-29]|uniref:hypothetical protein n=1 Tax=Ferruginibacter sp. HRS2-29 TaxID=2487334 RepID=UPI0020CCB9DA